MAQVKRVLIVIAVLLVLTVCKHIIDTDFGQHSSTDLLDIMR